MIDDKTPHRIFRIVELARLIASRLVLTNLKSAVGLACARRCLEEPVLSTLREIQHAFRALLDVFREETLELERRPTEYVVRGRFPLMERSSV